MLTSCGLQGPGFVGEVTKLRTKSLTVQCEEQPKTMAQFFLVVHTHLYEIQVFQRNLVP